MRPCSILLAGFTLSIAAAPSPAQAVPPLAREFRGVWVATVDNIDWPSSAGLSTGKAQRELDDILDRARDLHLNAIILQVRPCADALYVSQLEPWSEWLTGAQGRPPDVAWDPLAHAVAGAHARGLELHAWFNPFRARHSKSTSRPSPSHVTALHPGWCIPYGDQIWLDPGNPAAAAFSLQVIADVVARYDVDGVHVDDYFYPYPVKGATFADDASYRGYQRRGGKLARDDWRRANIDDFVRRLAAGVHQQKAWVKVGISPFGIARPGEPAGVKAGVDQFGELYADAAQWLRDGLCDYMAPQLYWPIDQKEQSFALLLPWWREQNPKSRHLWPGLNTSRAVQGKKPWRDGEILQQIGLIRGLGSDPGHIHFSSRALVGGDLAAQLRQRAYADAALVPVSPWLREAAPSAPVCRRDAAGTATVVSWQGGAAARFAVVQVLQGDQWRHAGTFDAAAARAELAGVAATTPVAVTLIGRTGIASDAVVVGAKAAAPLVPR